ncbi:LysE family translocator [Marinactinospora rubrisoli]|uniref:LysE family translocator n=1 Tax=Marinactinospora rubrisoli TaxID=2715399 RepID=A0ABW2KNG5_9ACTN
MTWTLYLSFLAFATVIVIAPGPDFAVVLKNSLTRRRAGLLAALGITTSNMVHGTAAAIGVGALLLSSQVLFTTVRWIGIAYLCYLGVQALLSARRGDYPTADDSGGGPPLHGLRSWSQGFLSNITNPKVLAFYLSVLPQFLAGGEGSLAAVLLLAYSHAALGLLWLVLVVAFLHYARSWVLRRPIRRTLDAGTGVALLGFAAALALEPAGTR